MQRVETMSIPGTQVLSMPAIPMSQIVYGEIVYWLTIASALIAIIGPALALVSADHNVMNPGLTFSAIFSGQSIAEVWAVSNVGGFPGGHFYLQHLLTGDGITQLGIALGCGVALPGLLGSAASFVRSRSYGYVMLSLWVAFLVFFAAAGIVNLH